MRSLSHYGHYYCCLHPDWRPPFGFRRRRVSVSHRLPVLVIAAVGKDSTLSAISKRNIVLLNFRAYHTLESSQPFNNSSLPNVPTTNHMLPQKKFYSVVLFLSHDMTLLKGTNTHIVSASLCHSNVEYVWYRCVTDSKNGPKGRSRTDICVHAYRWLQNVQHSCSRVRCLLKYDVSCPSLHFTAHEVDSMVPWQ